MCVCVCLTIDVLHWRKTFVLYAFASMRSLVLVERVARLNDTNWSEQKIDRLCLCELITHGTKSNCTDFDERRRCDCVCVTFFFFSNVLPLYLFGAMCMVCIVCALRIATLYTTIRRLYAGRSWLHIGLIKTVSLYKTIWETGSSFQQQRDKSQILRTLCFPTPSVCCFHRFRLDFSPGSRIFECFFSAHFIEF